MNTKKSKQSTILTIAEILKKKSFTPSDLNNVNISEEYINEESFNNPIFNNVIEKLKCIPLKNCPSCDIEPGWTNLGNLERGHYLVGCERCSSYTPCFNNEDDAANHWNLSASPSNKKPFPYD